MKRSEYIALGAVGLLMVAAAWPRHTQEVPEADPAISKGDGFMSLAFASVEECKAAQAVTASTCEGEFSKAQEASVADAPKFEALADCEAEYGASQCRAATWSGASVFVPAMAGVLLARSLANSAASTRQPLYPPRVGLASCPPGVSLADRPECAPRSSSSSSGSGSSSSSSGSSSSRSYYSTGTGRVVGRVVASGIADVFLPSRTSISRTSVTRPAWSGSSSSSVSRPSSSSTSTTSRGGFGSTGRSFSSSSS